jgi:hypothetical protein
MALFLLWRESLQRSDPAPTLVELGAQAHIAGRYCRVSTFETAAGRWRLLCWPTATHFYQPDTQVWQDDALGLCIIHGLIWRVRDGAAELLDASAVAALLRQPGDRLPDDVGGEYSVARVFADGSLTAFSDRAGLHQVFRGRDGQPVLSNRASLVAACLGDLRPDPTAQRWLAAIGYRVGTTTAFASVVQIGQGRTLTIDGDGSREQGALLDGFGLQGPRGWSAGDGQDLDRGIVQAQAAIGLGIPAEGPVDLPITGGKDSRVVLALCLSMGLRDRLRLFTRGYEGHPDVAAGRRIAEALGLPYRREAPHGSDEPAFWSRERFFAKLATQAWQTDAMVGGWDLILGQSLGRETLISGHMGEVLKTYSKKKLSEGLLDPAAMVRLQAPFDPMDVLLPEARAALEAELCAQMDEARTAGAIEADLPDLFYYRNRLPNWLGAIRAIKSFERQPVVPLGAPALLDLAFRLTPEERAREMLHYRIIERTAPELLPLPFALQTWDPALGEGVARADPILPTAGAPPVFGNWQYSLNHNVAIRAALARLIEARPDLTLWTSIDREALLDRLRHRRFVMFDAISLLGIVVVLLHEAGLAVPARLGEQGGSDGGAATLDDLTELPKVDGHLDAVVEEDDHLRFDGWAYCGSWPGAQPAIEVRVAGRVLAVAAALNERPDLIPHGMGDGRHGFSIAVPRDRLRPLVDESGQIEVILTPFDSDGEIARRMVRP